MMHSHLLLLSVILSLCCIATNGVLFKKTPITSALQRGRNSILNVESLEALVIHGGDTKYRKNINDSTGVSKNMKSKKSLFSKFKELIHNLMRPFLPKTRKIVNSTRKDSSLARIQKEMQEFLDNPPANCKLTSVNKNNIRKWIVAITGVHGTVFAGEQYKLCLEFSKQYPAKPPSVYFLKPAPKHVHCYTNGDICLSILGKDWRPTMTAQSIVVSILSMLSSAKSKGLPVDNVHHADLTPGQQLEYMYHDDKC